MGLADEPPDDLIDRLKRRAAVGSTVRQRRRSSLFEMMMNHRAEFATLIAGRTWQGFADDLTAEGVVNADGDPLTAERVRKTWFLVNKRAGAKTRKPAKAAMRHAVPPATLATAEPSVAPTAEPEVPNRHQAAVSASVVPRQFQRSKLKD